MIGALGLICVFVLTRDGGSPVSAAGTFNVNSTFPFVMTGQGMFVCIDREKERISIFDKMIICTVECFGAVAH